MATATINVGSAFNGAVTFSLTYNTSSGAVTALGCVNNLGVQVYVEIAGATTGSIKCPPGASTLNVTRNVNAVVDPATLDFTNFTLTTRAPA